MPDRHPPDSTEAVGLYYHLDELVPIEPKKQLMMFGHRLAHPGQSLASITLQVTDPDAALYLAALTLRQSGPRMNALVYQGKSVKPYPDDTPQAAPSPLEALRDPSREICLNGPWLHKTDPGNLGIRQQFFAPDHDTSDWQRMPVPSQWYVGGLDYHGVVWFRRDFDVPVALAGDVFPLCFGGVDYDARVWLNGQYLGRHIGAFRNKGLILQRFIATLWNGKEIVGMGFIDPFKRRLSLEFGSVDFPVDTVRYLEKNKIPLTGGVDLSLGSMVALTGVIAASFAHPGDYPLAIPLFLGILSGLVCGTLNGMVVTRGRVAPFIVTLGMMTVARGLALVISGGRPVSNLSGAFCHIAGGDVLGVPIPVLILALVTLLSHVLLRNTRLGR